MPTIAETFSELHQHSAELAAKARGQFPSGVTHDARYTAPFPLFMARSSAARKWDVDENELIDYITGHGALILGHGHPNVVTAVQRQMALGTHLGAEHPLALQWASLVQQHFPSVERLRFTASGTEATMLALRLARAYTGREKVIRFFGHYHGWHDLLARDAEADRPVGVPEAILGTTIVLPIDLNQVAAALASNDIAAVILEPTGASYGMVPLEAGFLAGLRELTNAHSSLLICDEVVTGFRVAAGGEQQRSGVQADLTTFAKILAGGLPGGAVGGRAEILKHLDFGDPSWNREHKIRHNGTFNANPLSAAAGVATLEQLADGTVNEYVRQMAERLIAGFNRVLQAYGLAGWAAYGDGSIFHLIAASSVPFAAGELPAAVTAAELKRGGNPEVLSILRMALVNHGVDLMRGRSGFTSLAHTPAEIDATIRAFEAALADLIAEKIIQPIG